MNIKIDSTLDALKQGDLDKLCGIYAIINAIRLGASPEIINKKTQRELMRSALQYLSKREMLQETLRNGMSSRNFIKLADKLLERSNRIVDATLKITHFPGDGELPENFIQNELSRNAPICARLKGPFDHFTVISGMTQKRYLLADSNGLSWINRSSLRNRNSSAPARLRIQLKSLFSISADRTEMDTVEQISSSSKRLWEMEEEGM
ncbi:MAG: cysteine peptidase family C39 domain-containing protein [Henriciella sp.]